MRLENIHPIPLSCHTRDNQRPFVGSPSLKSHYSHTGQTKGERGGIKSRSAGEGLSHKFISRYGKLVLVFILVRCTCTHTHICTFTQNDKRFLDETS